MNNLQDFHHSFSGFRDTEHLIEFVIGAHIHPSFSIQASLFGIVVTKYPISERSLEAVQGNGFRAMAVGVIPVGIRPCFSESRVYVQGTCVSRAL